MDGFEYSTLELDNSMRVHYSHFTCPDVYFYWHIGYGYAHEPPEWNGLSHFSEHLLFIDSPDAEESIKDRYRYLTGRSINAGTSLEMTYGNTVMPVESFSDFCLLFRNMISNDEFEKRDFGHEKRVVLSENKMREQSRENSILSEVDSYLFPDHPYGEHCSVSDEQVLGFSQEDVGAYRDEVYVGENMQAVVVGGISAEGVESELNRTLGSVPRGRKVDSIPEPEPCSGGGVQVSGSRPDGVLVYYQAPAMGSPDSILLGIVSDYLGMGQDSLLFKELRERRGVYAAGSKVTANLVAGTMSTKALGIGEVAHDEIISVIREQEDKIIEEGVDEEWFEGYKRVVKLTYHEAYLSSPARRRNLLFNALTLGKSYLFDKVEFLNSISNEDLMRVADSVFSQPSLEVKIIHEKRD